VWSASYTSYSEEKSPGTYWIGGCVGYWIFTVTIVNGFLECYWYKIKMNDTVRSMKAITKWRAICRRNKKGSFIECGLGFSFVHKIHGKYVHMLIPRNSSQLFTLACTPNHCTSLCAINWHMLESFPPCGSNNYILKTQVWAHYSVGICRVRVIISVWHKEGRRVSTLSTVVLH